MPVITLTTDLGNKDFYIPLVKGCILSAMPSANIIDITHQIQPFNLAEASFILKGCYAGFPEGTVHIVSVDSDNNSSPEFIAVKTEKYVFISYDNGLVSLVLEKENIKSIVKIPVSSPGQLVFPLKDLMVPAAIKLLEGALLEEIGTPAQSFRQKTHLHPLIEESIIRGNVIYNDNLGNAITNITQNMLDTSAKGRKFIIHINRQERIDKISKHYGEVPAGEKLCLCGAAGYLEIAINQGAASGLLGLRPGNSILIEFL